MKTIQEIINELANKFSSLNYDYLTEKELDKTEKFLDSLERSKVFVNNNPMYLSHPDWAIKLCIGTTNSLKSYLKSLKLKIKKRKDIPNWYIQNKL